MSDADPQAALELDGRICEIMEPIPSRPPSEVIGCPVSAGGWWVWNGMGWMPNKDPSTDWSAAGEVLQWIRQQPEPVQDAFYMALAAQWQEWCSEQPTTDDEEKLAVFLMTGTGRWFVLHADIPLAICLAAKAVEKQAQTPHEPA